MKDFLSAVLLIILLSTSTAYAEIKTYKGIGVHYMNDTETAAEAKNQAELLAARDALEQVCLYVKNQANSRNLSLKDEIIIIATGILHIVSTKFEISTEENTLVVTSFITANIDTEELEKLLAKTLKERNLK